MRPFNTVWLTEDRFFHGGELVRGSTTSRVNESLHIHMLGTLDSLEKNPEGKWGRGRAALIWGASGAGAALPHVEPCRPGPWSSNLIPRAPLLASCASSQDAVGHCPCPEHRCNKTHGSGNEALDSAIRDIPPWKILEAGEDLNGGGGQLNRGGNEGGIGLLLLATAFADSQTQQVALCVLRGRSGRHRGSVPASDTSGLTSVHLAPLCCPATSHQGNFSAFQPQCRISICPQRCAH